MVDKNVGAIAFRCIGKIIKHLDGSTFGLGDRIVEQDNDFPLDLFVTTADGGLLSDNRQWSTAC
jgi:hypothetical protein